MSLFNSLGLEGRCAIVTGSARGIGLAVARALHAEGAKVLAVDIDGEALGNLQLESAAFPTEIADLSSPGECRRVAKIAKERFGNVHILVNVAGIVDRHDFADLGHEDWQKLLDVNLTSQAFLCQAVVPQMLECRWGRIVNFSSIAAQQGGRVGTTAYSVSKGGTLSLTRSLARQLAEVGITANAISPGIVNTRMITETLSKRQIEELKSSIPTGRVTEPEEIAAMTVLLCSDWGRSITGQTIKINGGLFVS